jgi:hypothetical protein
MQDSCRKMRSAQSSHIHPNLEIGETFARLKLSTLIRVAYTNTSFLKSHQLGLVLCSSVQSAYFLVFSVGFGYVAKILNLILLTVMRNSTARINQSMSTVANMLANPTNAMSTR